MARAMTPAEMHPETREATTVSRYELTSGLILVP